MARSGSCRMQTGRGPKRLRPRTQRTQQGGGLKAPGAIHLHHPPSALRPAGFTRELFKLVEVSADVRPQSLEPRQADPVECALAQAAQFLHFQHVEGELRPNLYGRGRARRLQWQAGWLWFLHCRRTCKFAWRRPVLATPHGALSMELSQWSHSCVNQARVQ